MADSDDLTYQPPAGDAVLLAMGEAYTAPAGDQATLTMIGPPGPYEAPAGGAVALDLTGDYTAPAGDAVALNLVHAGWVSPGAGEVEVIITSSLSAPSHDVRVDAVLPITVASTLAAPQHRATLAADINVYRDPSLLTTSGWPAADWGRDRR